MQSYSENFNQFVWNSIALTSVQTLTQQQSHSQDFTWGEIQKLSAEKFFSQKCWRPFLVVAHKTWTGSIFSRIWGPQNTSGKTKQCYFTLLNKAGPTSQQTQFFSVKNPLNWRLGVAWPSSPLWLCNGPHFVISGEGGFSPLSPILSTPLHSTLWYSPKRQGIANIRLGGLLPHKHSPDKLSKLRDHLCSCYDLLADGTRQWKPNATLAVFLQRHNIT